MTEAINYEEEDMLEGGTVSVIGVYGGFMQPLLERIRADAPSGCEMFLHKRDDCEKVVLST